MPRKVLDRGPLYVETDQATSFLFEPWNTLSNLLFLIIIIFWFMKIFKRPKDFLLISISLPILFTGFLGGTIYHATRSANIWLYLDFIPIILLCFMAAVFFWKILLNNPFLSFLIASAFVFTPRLLLINLDLPFYIFVTGSYSSLALMILLPAYLFSFKNNKVGLVYLNVAVISFVLAISFRSLDRQLAFLLPMGSHFLWHLFGALATHCLLFFIYKIYERDLTTKTA